MENKLTSKQYIDAAVALAKFSLQAKSEVRWKDEWTDEIAVLVQFPCAERNRIYGSTSGPIPTEDEMKGKYVGVPGVAPVSINEVISDGYCSQCGADYTQPEIPYAHKSVAGNIMPGHKEVVMEDRKCPHYEVRFRSQQNYNSQTGKPDYKPAGWYCAWCGQPFGLSPSLDPHYESIDSGILESVLKKGKDRDDKNI